MHSAENLAAISVFSEFTLALTVTIVGGGLFSSSIFVSLVSNYNLGTLIKARMGNSRERHLSAFSVLW